MDNDLKIGISAVRFPMALLVVLIHCTLNTEQPFLRAVMNGGGKIATIAVPVFFFLSGYLFQEHCNSWALYKKKLKKRVKSVLVPYIVFNILAILIFYAKNPGDISMQDFCGRIFVSPQNFPLWYLQNLMLLFLLTPAVMLLDNRYVDFLWLATTLFLFVVFMGDDELFLKVRNWGFCFYNIGAFCNKYCHDLSLGKKYTLLFLLLGIISFMMSYRLNNYYYIQYYNLFIVLFIVFNLRVVGRIMKYFVRLYKYSSFIYFAHTLLVAGACVSVANKYYCNVVGYFATPVIVSLILMVVYETMSRLFPKGFCLIIGK